MTLKPQRIQLSRRPGFDLQKVSRKLNGLPAVSVARPHKFGNPYKLSHYLIMGHDGKPAPLAVQKKEATEMAVRDFEAWLYVSPDGEKMVEAARKELRGKNLACFCPLNSKLPCHADILLRIARGGSVL